MTKIQDCSIGYVRKYNNAEFKYFNVYFNNGRHSDSSLTLVKLHPRK